jgi:hypothetical protein
MESKEMSDRLDALKTPDIGQHVIEMTSKELVSHTEKLHTTGKLYDNQLAYALYKEVRRLRKGLDVILDLGDEEVSVQARQIARAALGIPRKVFED